MTKTETVNVRFDGFRVTNRTGDGEIGEKLKSVSAVAWANLGPR